MGLAAYNIEPDSKEQFRYMIHDEVDKWVDQIIDEVFEDDRQPTVMELSPAASGICRNKAEVFWCLFSSLD